MKPASQIAADVLGTIRWHHGAGEWEAPSAIRNPPRFQGKPREAPQLSATLHGPGEAQSRTCPTMLAALARHVDQLEEIHDDAALTA